MLETDKICSRYAARRLSESNVDEILALCKGNPLFYQYCEAEMSREQILKDLQITPPGVDISNKYYLGLYDEGRLFAVLDLIDGYPEEGIVFIGFFIVDISVQGKGVGSRIIDSVAYYLTSIGKTSIRLGIDKGNPQSTSFWKKNGFVVTKEIEREGGIVLLAEKKLS